jgi:hypothetical protein
VGKTGIGHEVIGNLKTNIFTKHGAPKLIREIELPPASLSKDDVQLAWLRIFDYDHVTLLLSTLSSVIHFEQILDAGLPQHKPFRVWPFKFFSFCLGAHRDRSIRMGEMNQRLTMGLDGLKGDPEFEESILAMQTNEAKSHKAWWEGQCSAWIQNLLLSSEKERSALLISQIPTRPQGLFGRESRSSRDATTHDFSCQPFGKVSHTMCHEFWRH